MKKYLIVACLIFTAFTSGAAAHGNVTITDGWLRVAPNQVAGAFFKVKNESDEDLTIVAAFAIGAETVEMHSHKMVKGVMKMRKEEYVELPASAEVKFHPHGYHLMMFKLDKDKFGVGNIVNVTLNLSDGSEVKAEFLVKKFGH